MKQKISEKFQTLFQTEGEFFASAGRINLIGEHTDYNGGFVFPGAIDKGMIAEIKLNGTQTVKASLSTSMSTASSVSTRRMHLHRAGQAISSVYAVRFRREVERLQVSTLYSQVTFLLEQVCLLLLPLRAHSLMHSTNSSALASTSSNLHVSARALSITIAA